ncbi:MAG: hypothetical protein D6699_07980, partial [Aquificota bacterium]
MGVNLLIAFLLLVISVSFGEEKKSVVFTFRELNLLSEDMLLKGINAKYDFFVPALTQLDQGRVLLKLTVSPYLRQDSSITLLVDDVPYKTFRTVELPPEVEIPFKRRKNRDFVKITIAGNLRLSNNICEDVFSDKVYMLIDANSKVEFTYSGARNIREFLNDYDNLYCINSPELLPFVYQLCKYSPVPCKVLYGFQTAPLCKRIEPSNDSTLRLEKGTLYVPALVSIPFETKLFPNFLFGGSQEIKKVDRENEKLKTEMPFGELGYKTASVEGVGNINYTIPLDTARLEGLPDRLYLRLFIAHTPVHKRDNMELRIYLNGKMVQAYT